MSGSYRIPFFGIDRQYKSISDEIIRVTDRVFSSGQVLDGVFTKEFERAIADMTQRRYAVAVNSGTQALIFSLRSLILHNLSLPKKVLIPGISYIATVNAVLEANADPVYCDVDPITGLLDINEIAVPANNIDILMYVNLFGNCINYEKLKTFDELFRNNKVIIEDAAQSFGASWNGIPSGKLGTISCLSFDPTKNLNNYGSGGMVLTDSLDICETVRDLRNNGKTHDHIASGTNSRMSEVDCAQMLVKLNHFDAWQHRRQEIADYYTSELRDYVLVPEVDERVTHAWSKYVIHHHDRGEIKHQLDLNSIETRIHYEKPLTLEGVSFMSMINTSNHDILENAEEFCKTSLSLPIYPELTDEEVETIVSVIQYGT